MTKKAILNNWKTDMTGFAQGIPILVETEYPAWTVRFLDSYGVAIPYKGSVEINETFSNARIRSTTISFRDSESKSALVLTSDSEEISVPFSSLCEAFVDPGEDGRYRKEINKNPLDWWKKWKELLGNKNIDERIYDTLGELCVLCNELRNGRDAEWNGPKGTSYDLERDDCFIEVKSTVNRSKREVTISNHFQLFPPGKPLFIVLCVFEPSVMSGMSIDSVLDEIESFGYNTDPINQQLESMGLEKGMSSRKKCFILHQMLRYDIDDTFPRITPDSFVGGVLPEGIVKITYTVDLSGMTPSLLMDGDNNDIQDN